MFCRAALRLLLLLPAVAGRAQSVPQLESVMYQDPRLDLPAPIDVFREDLKQTWIAALRSEEADLKQEAAYALVWAVQHGMTDVQDAIQPLLMNLSTDARLSVRLSSARALTVLEARSAAGELFERARTDGLEMAQIVEPALARWRFPPVQEIWRARLRDESVSTAWRLLAIRGLGQVQDSRSAADLQALAAQADGDRVVRLAAAEAVPRIVDRGLEPLARQLIDRRSETPVIEHLIAAHLLRGHSSAASRELLVELSLDDAPSVAAAALVRLVEIDPDRILPLAEPILAKGDAKVRRLVAEALIARPSSTSIRQLGDLLGDPHPGLRAFVGKSLQDLARSDLWTADVVQQGERMIASDRWQSLEQALLLLARLDQKARATRCQELLHHQRPEVYVTAAWALERLGVEETFEPALEFAQKRYAGDEGDVSDAPFDIGIEEQLAQLFQLFGRNRYARSGPFLRRFVPKSDELPVARAAAIWALGCLHEGKPDEQLAQQLTGRLRDVGPPQPEYDIVRRFSAVSLGRMGARQSMETLRSFRGTGALFSEVNYACAWALQLLTGETYDDPQPPQRRHTNFFLEPLPETRTRPAVTR